MIETINKIVRHKEIMSEFGREPSRRTAKKLASTTRES